MPEEPKQNKRDIIVDFGSGAAGAGGTSWFFGIGINTYTHFPPLNNAVKDVQDLVKLLQSEYNLTAEHTLTLYDGEATRKNVITMLDRLQTKVGPSDELLIYYSGHGHLNKKIGKGYWIPVDAERDNTSAYIRNSTIREYIETIPTLHTLLISDSCFSGSLFVRGASRSTATIKQLAAIPSRWAFCSGRHDEEVFDGEPGANSPFAESIMDTLRRNQDKQINIARLIDRVVEQTRSNYNQLPEGNPLFGVGHKGGQYIFNRRADEREDWAKAKAGGTLTAYRQFLANHPNGKHADEARENIAFLEEEAAWEKAKASNTILAYYEYDQAYPKGRYSRHALDAITELEEEAAWRKAERRDMLSDYRRYTANYPKGKYRAEADARISAIISGEQEPALWKQTTLRNTPEAYAAYLKQYPEGAYAREARDRQSELERAAAGKEKAESRKQEAEHKQREEEQRLSKEEAAWKAAQEADTEAAYRNFYLSHPRGRFAEEAKMAMKKFQEAAVDPAPGQEVKKPELAGVSRAAAPLPSEPEGENPLRKWLPIAIGGILGIVLVLGIINWSGADEEPVSSADLIPYQDPSNKSLYGYKTETGSVVIQPAFEQANPFIQDRALVKINNLYGYIGPNGDLVVPAQYERAKDFANGLAVVSKDQKFGFIGPSGDIVIPLKYSNADSFNNRGEASVALDGASMTINKQGDCIRGCPKDEEKAWFDALDKGTKEAFQAYRKQFPQGKYFDRAGEEIKRLEKAENIIRDAKNDEQAWKAAMNQHTIAAYKQYQRKYPKGKGQYYSEAGERIKELEEEEAWSTAQSSKTIYSYNRYLSDYPNGKYAKEAISKKAILEEEQAWKAAQSSNTIDSYNRYLRYFPNGRHSVEAGRKIDELTPTTDKRSDYKTIALNGKTWLAENLNLKVSKSWCYNDQDENCHKYGRLYNWQAAQEACKKLGAGWRLPTDAEWSALMKKYGEATGAYKALAKEGSTGFNALLGGRRDPDGKFHVLNRNGDYWSGTEKDKTTEQVWFYNFNKGHGKLFRGDEGKWHGLSCRCIKD